MIIFPEKTVQDIFINFKKYSIDKKIEFITPLCKEGDKIYFGNVIKEGTSYGIHGSLPQENVCRGKWVGELHSHTEVKTDENFIELAKGMSEDDVNHAISGILKGEYNKFPALFCVAAPVKDTKDEFWLEVQCEKLEKIKDTDVVDTPRNTVKPIFDYFDIFEKEYPKTPINRETIQIWKKERGYPSPFRVDINKLEKDLHATKGKMYISKEDAEQGYRATIFFQADMANIKNVLRKKGLLTSDEFTIRCKRKYMSRQKKPLLVCSFSEQKLDL